jgi:hypothetical protein
MAAAGTFPLQAREQLPTTGVPERLQVSSGAMLQQTCMAAIPKRSSAARGRSGQGRAERSGAQRDRDSVSWMHSNCLQLPAMLQLQPPTSAPIPHAAGSCSQGPTAERLAQAVFQLLFPQQPCFGTMLPAAGPANRWTSNQMCCSAAAGGQRPASSKTLGR